MFNFKILNTLRLKSILYEIGIYISLHDISSERQLKPHRPPFRDALDFSFKSTSHTSTKNVLLDS